jgi:hypothetical protein
MIRRIVIVMLSLATIITSAVWAVSFRTPVLCEVPAYTLEIAALDGRLILTYRHPAPFTLNATPYKTVVEWFESLDRSPRIPICPACQRPENDHAPHCFMRGVYVDLFSPREDRVLAWRGGTWHTQVRDGWRTNEARAVLWPAIPLLGAFPLVAFFRGPLRRYRRQRRNLCVQCGYNLTGLIEPRCPECGTPIRAGRSP